MASKEFLDFQIVLGSQKEDLFPSYSTNNHYFHRVLFILCNNLLSEFKYTFLNFISHILEQEMKFQTNPKIRFFYKDVSIITREDWQEFNLTILQSEEFVLVEIQKPNSHFLRNKEFLDRLIISRDGNSEFIYEELLDNYSVKKDFSISMDEFLLESFKQTNQTFTRYFSNAQRKALSAVLSMKENSTLVKKRNWFNYA